MSHQPVVTTVLGVLKGVVLESLCGRKFYGFLGVPYAKPPVGKLRFKESIPGEPWTGVLNANRIPNMCVQLPRPFGAMEKVPLDVIGSEDCLYLNIYTPKLPADLPDGQLLDVIFYIHGGAFLFYSGDVWGPEHLMDCDAVFVNFNYRLGVLGFLSLEDETCPGNNGLKDQTLALKWVNEHIADFGGDPNKITIAGMSSGGASVHYHMLSPLSKGLFQKAITASGVVQNPWAITKNPRKMAIALAKAVGCVADDSASILKCLRERTAEQLVAALGSLKVWGDIPPVPMGPVIEQPSATAFIDQQPDDLIKSKAINDVPVLFSHTNDEGSFLVIWASVAPHLIQEFDRLWNKLAPYAYEYKRTADPSNAKDLPRLIREHYLGDNKLLEALPDFIRSISDRMFLNGIHQAAMLHAEYQDSPVYMYRFSYPGDGFNVINSYLNKVYKGGASHGLDHSYTLNCKAYPPINSPEATAMAQTMVGYWMSFITESPIPKWSTVKSGLPKLTFMDIVSPDPAHNVFKTEDPDSLPFWESLKLRENSVENMQPTACNEL